MLRRHEDATCTPTPRVGQHRVKSHTSSPAHFSVASVGIPQSCGRGLRGEARNHALPKPRRARRRERERERDRERERAGERRVGVSRQDQRAAAATSRFCSALLSAACMMVRTPPPPRARGANGVSRGPRSGVAPGSAPGDGRNRGGSACTPASCTPCSAASCSDQA